MNLALNPAFWQTACYTKCEERALRYNGFWLCDGGFYAVQSFKTAIAKPVLYEVFIF